MPAPALSRSAALLAGWEAAATLPAVARPAALVAHLGPDESWDALVDLPVGDYTAAVAGTYAEHFGPEVDVLVACRACGEQLEATLDVRDIAGAPSGGDGSAQAAVSGGTVTVRSPTLRDLLAVGTAPDGPDALRARCLRWADGRSVDAAARAAFSAADLAAVDAAAERLAGPAAASLAACCPGCGTDVRAPIDVGLLLWERAGEAAQRLLAEVALLARAFGWSERAVLDLSPPRRAAYLALVAVDEVEDGQGWP